MLGGTRTYALIINNIYECKYLYPSIGNADVEKITAILQSNPKIVMNNPEPNPVPLNEYDLYIDDKVVGKIYYTTNSQLDPKAEMINAALQSDPYIVDITDFNPLPEIGWIWDGTNLIDPNI